MTASEGNIAFRAEDVVHGKIIWNPAGRIQQLMLALPETIQDALRAQLESIMNSLMTSCALAVSAENEDILLKVLRFVDQRAKDTVAGVTLIYDGEILL